MPFAIKRFSWLSWSGYTALKAQSLVFTQKSKHGPAFPQILGLRSWQRFRCRWLLEQFFPFPLQAFNDRVVNFQADLRNKNDQTCIFIRLSAVHSQGKSNIFSVRFFDLNFH